MEMGIVQEGGRQQMCAGSERKLVDGGRLQPYVIVAPDGVFWLGHAESEATAWNYATGWEPLEDIEQRKTAGWYCASAVVTWHAPSK